MLRKTHKKELYKHIAEKIENVYNTGQAWGLTEEQIDLCIENAILSDPSENVKESFSSKLLNTFYFIFKSFLCGIVMLIGLVFAVYVITSWHPKSDVYVRQLIQPYSYHLFRLVRLTTLPITQSLYLPQILDNECLVTNPFFLEPELDCSTCARLARCKSITRKKLQRFHEQFLDTATPVIFKDAMDRVVTFGNLKDLYHDNKSKIMSGLTLLEISNTSIKAVEELFELHNEEDVKNLVFFHALWVSWKIESSRVTRTLFPKPYFIPKGAEVSFQTLLYLDGARAKPYTLPPGAFRNMYYVQAHGSRTLVLIPKRECLFECKPIQITMQPKEIVYYNDRFWRADSITVPGTHATGEISIAYIGAFD